MGVRGHAPQEVFGFELSKVPFPVFPTDFRKTVETGMDPPLPGCTFAELEQATNSELTNLYSWLKANKLSLNIAKTEFMVVSSRQKFLAENCGEFNIQLDNQPISRVEHAKSLGLIIDDRLSWSNHIKEL